MSLDVEQQCMGGLVRGRVLNPDHDAIYRDDSGRWCVVGGSVGKQMWPLRWRQYQLWFPTCTEAAIELNVALREVWHKIIRRR